MRSASRVRAHEIMGEHCSTFYPRKMWRRQAAWALEIAEREGRYEDEGCACAGRHALLGQYRDQSDAGLAGRPHRYAKVTRDLTQRRRADQALAQTNQELERSATRYPMICEPPLRASTATRRRYSRTTPPGST